MDKKWQQLKDWINESDNIVFFGGAGVSTESGIPDFRSVDGLYNQKYKYPPERIISHLLMSAGMVCVVLELVTSIPARRLAERIFSFLPF